MRDEEKSKEQLIEELKQLRLKIEELEKAREEWQRPDETFNLLIVDDEQNVLNSLKRVLQHEPYEIFTSTSAMKGMDILKNQKIDIVLSDFAMPEMSGIDFFRQVRALYPDTLRIMLTGKAGYKEAIEAINEKLVYRYLTKPWGNEELKVALRQSVEFKQSQETLQEALRELQIKNRELSQSLSQIEELQELNENILNNMMSGLIVMDLEGKLLKINKTALEILNIKTEEQVIEQSVTSINPSLEAFYQFTQLPEMHEVELIHPEISSTSIGFFSNYLSGPDGDNSYIITIFKDLTELKQAQDDLQQERNFVSAVLDIVGALIVVCDRDGKVVRLNRACEQSTGYNVDEVMGECAWDVGLSPEEVGPVRDFFKEAKPDQFPLKSETYLITKDEKRRLIEWSNTALIDDEGEIDYVISTGIDITDRKEAEDRIRYLAFHDNLTDLPNRRLFFDRLDYALSRVRRQQNMLALLYIDVDELKTVNDTFGHEAGDKVLIEASQRMKNCLREMDALARIGGDEFAVIIQDIDDINNVEIVAKKIISNLGEPFHINDNDCPISASIGISVYPSDGNNSEILLQKADYSMYQAKKSGKEKYAFFNPNNSNSKS